MRLETGFMRELLLRGVPHIAYASAPLSEIQRQGIRALYTFIRISRDTVDKAASKVEAQIAVQHLVRLFEDSNVEDAIEEIPDLGLAWEAWLGLEEEFAVPRSYALEFARGLRMETENFRPETVQELLGFCYRTGGVLGLVLCHILSGPESAMQAMVDAASAARLTSLSRNLNRDFGLGKIFVPLDWFSRATTTRLSDVWSVESARRFDNLAFVLDKSARETLQVLPFVTRISLSLAIVLHQEGGSSVFRKIDRAIDEMLRQSGTAALRWLRSITAISHAEFPLTTKSERPLPPRDAAFAIRNQNLRFSRDL